MENFDNPLKFRDWSNLLFYSTGHRPVILNSDCSVIVFLFCLCFIKKNKSVDHSLYLFQGAKVSLGNTMLLSSRLLCQESFMGSFTFGIKAIIKDSCINFFNSMAKFGTECILEDDLLSASKRLSKR